MIYEGSFLSNFSCRIIAANAVVIVLYQSPYSELGKNEQA